MIHLLALGLPALAFAPDADVHIGTEPTRVYRFHTEVQRDLRQADAWQRFRDGAGAGWMVRFDERTGTPLRAWGAGISLGDPTDQAAVVGGLRQLLGQHSGLVGVPLSQLRLGRAQHDPETDSWILRLDQVVAGPNRATGDELDQFEHFASHGQPVVWRGAVHAKVRFGKLVSLGIQTYPGAQSVDSTPTLSARDAFDVAIGAGPHPDAVHDIEGASLAVLPLDLGGELTHRLVWMVRTETGEDRDLLDVRGKWVSFVDAHTGELLNVHNQVRYFGSVYGEHDTRTVNGDFTVSALPSLSIAGGSGSDTTDVGGGYELDGTVTAEFDGPHFRVDNERGSDASLSWGGGEVTWTDTDATQAEIDTWVFLHEVRDWSLDYAPDVTLSDEKLVSTVNIASSCNAYYDGNVNFYRSGSGCNNTGRIRDVNHHEWGHGFHYYAAYSSYVDGSVGEGAGDILAFLFSEDPVVAPYFMESGSGIRRVDTDYRYPEDVVGEVHQDGLIFAGAFWDLWGLLQDEVGDEVAYGLTSELYTRTLQQNPELATSYDDAVVADDDNGDLSDGTPNLCTLIEAFERHGLGPSGSGGGLVGLAMDTLENQSPDSSEYPLLADVLIFAESCVSAEPEGGTVHFSTDDGATWQTAELDADTESVSGAIPAVADSPAIVQYYVDMEYASDGEVSVATVPPGGPIAPFTFVVGDLEQIYCEDFEDDDGGYSHELVAGSAQEGADDWMWDRPRGMSEDPDFAFSGSRVWGNDLGGGNYNGAYQANKHNRLQSIPIDVSGHDGIVIQYRRWLNVEDSTYDQAMVTANDAVIWTNHGSSASDEHTADRQWALHSLEVPAEAIGEDGLLTLGWEIQSDGGLEFGGWNIDDVCVYGVTGLADSGDGEDGPDGEDDVGEEAGGADPVDGSTELAACGGCATSKGGAAGGALALFGLAGLVARRRRDD